MLSSSALIGSEVLVPSRVYSKLTLGVDEQERSALFRHIIDYKKKLNCKAGRIDYFHILIFEIEQFLTKNAVKPKVIKEICKKNEKNSYYTTR